MTREYFMVVYRPKGSKTWTPVDGPNWYSKEISAKKHANKMTKINKFEEFVVAKCEVSKCEVYE